MAKKGETKVKEEELLEEAVEEKTEEKKPDPKEYFAAYEAASGRAKEAEDAFKEAQREKSQAVEDIYETFGAGPFVYKGNKLTIGRRGETYFFKGETTEGALVVD